MRLTVQHLTRYTYNRPARRVIQLLRLTPASFAGQTVLDWRIDVDCDARLKPGRDGYGNLTHMLYIDQPISMLEVSVRGLVLTEDKAGLVSGLPNELPPGTFARPTRLTQASAPLVKLANAMKKGGGGNLDLLHRLCARLYRDLRFDVAATGVETTADQAFVAGHGVCQDFAHIFIAAARYLGIPARYVSGHLYRRDGALQQEASHAWVEAWVDDLGWVGFDPANGISTDEAYVRVACGLDYRDAAPIAGARAGGDGETLTVAVEVHEGRVQAQAQTQG